MTNKKTYFKSSWLTNNAFAPWVGRSSLDTQAYCKLCKVVFELGNMGKKALNSPAKGHSKKVQDQAQIKNVFSSNTKPKTDNSEIDCSSYDNSGNNDIVEIETPGSGMEKVQTTIPTTYYDEKKMFAEIRWALKQVLCGYSDNSCEGTVNVFGVIFPDSEIVVSIELGRNKLKYIMNRGLVPYFKDIFTEDLGSAEFLSVCLDESLNKTTQNCEMDLVL